LVGGTNRGAIGLSSLLLMENTARGHVKSNACNNIVINNLQHPFKPI
jgi:hypothetical protein